MSASVDYPSGIMNQLTYTWDVNGDGLFDDATGQNPTLTLAQLVGLGITQGGSNYQVAVKVTDQDGLSAISPPAPLNVMGAIPSTVSAGGDYTVIPGTSLTLTASATLPAGATDPLNYAWDITGQGSFTDAYGQTVTLSWAQLEQLGVTGATTSLPVSVRVTNTTSGLASVSQPATLSVVSQPPTVAATAAATITTVTTTTAALSVLGADDGGESNLTYTWAAPESSAFPVAFSDNGTNAAKNTIATFNAPGSYFIQVTILDAGGLSTTSSFFVNVVSTITSVVIARSSSDLDIDGTEQFSATALDQFGSPLDFQPFFTWTATGGGSVDANGQFTPPYSAGSATLQASAGSSSDSLLVTFPGAAEWTGSVDTAWTSGSTWTDGSGDALVLPGLRGTAADTVLLAPATAQTLSLNGATPTVAAIAMDGRGGSPTLAAGSGGSLVLDNGVQSATVSVVAGTGVISAPIVLNSNLVVSSSAGSTASLSGEISGLGMSVSVDGQGMLILGGNNSYTGGTFVNAGTLVVSGSSGLPEGSSLFVGAAASLDFASLAAATPVVVGDVAVNGPQTVVVTSMPSGNGSNRRGLPHPSPSPDCNSMRVLAAGFEPLPQPRSRRFFPTTSRCRRRA